MQVAVCIGVEGGAVAVHSGSCGSHGSCTGGVSWMMAKTDDGDDDEEDGHENDAGVAGVAARAFTRR